MVAQPDRVGEALEADRVLVEPGNRQRAADRAEREQQLVVVELLGVALVGGQLDRVAGRVVAGDRAEAQVGALEDVAQRRDDVARLERAGGRLREQRRVEQEVDVVDEDQPGRLLRQDPLELAGGVGSREPSSCDDDVVSHELSLLHFVTDCYKVAEATCPALRGPASRGSAG